MNLFSIIGKLSFFSLALLVEKTLLHYEQILSAVYILITRASFVQGSWVLLQAATLPRKLQKDLGRQPRSPDRMLSQKERQ